MPFILKGCWSAGVTHPTLPWATVSPGKSIETSHHRIWVYTPPGYNFSSGIQPCNGGKQSAPQATLMLPVMERRTMAFGVINPMICFFNC